MAKNVTSLIFLLVVAAVALVVASMISTYTAKINDDIRTEETSVLGVNETSTYTVWGNTSYTIDNAAEFYSVTAVYNSTDLIPAADYTFVNGVFTLGRNSTAQNFTGYNLTFDYNYYYKSTVYSVAGNGSEGMENMSKQEGTIGTVVGAVIVITILFLGLGSLIFGSRKRAG